MKPNKPDHSVHRNRTFVPSELLIFFEHEPGFEQDRVKMIDSINNEISARLGVEGTKNSRLIPANYEQDFERLKTIHIGDNAISMLRMGLERFDTDSENIFRGIYTSIDNADKTTRQWVSDRDVIRYTAEINRLIRRVNGELYPRPIPDGRRRKNVRQKANLRENNPRRIAQRRPADVPLVARSAMPNWYNSAAQGERVGTGGPGGMATPAGSKVIHPINVQQILSSFSGRRAISYEELLRRSGAVEIAILDTLPSLTAIEAAFNSSLRDHPLFNALFIRHGALTIPNDLVRLTYDTTLHWSGMSLMEWLKHEVVIDHYEHPMADHGTFIASVIYQLLDHARSQNKLNVHFTFHLIQVLGDNGVGTTETIFNGIKQAFDHRTKNMPLLFNCSFTLLTPTEANPKLYLDGELTASAIPEFDTDVNATSRYSIETILDDLWQYEGVSIVAAAGNEGIDPNLAPNASFRHKARYPAAMPSVFGVASLEAPNTPNLAYYSNSPDNPLEQGFAAFGGAIDPNGVTDPVNGIYGLYIGETFPPSPGTTTPIPNTDGWAAWAGTSFAAPHVTAAMAIGRALVPDATPDEISDALRAASSGATTEGGDILPTRVQVSP